MAATTSYLVVPARVVRGVFGGGAAVYEKRAVELLEGYEALRHLD